jgi:multiple sugar transport system substrate-binding protein
MCRHRILRSAAAVVLGAVAGCTSAAPTPWPAGSDSATITIVSGSDTSLSPGNEPVDPGQDDNGMYQQLVDYWNAYEKPLYGFYVKLDMIPGGATAEHSEMLAAAQSGGENYDIYNLDSQWVSEFAAGGYLRSLQGQVNGGSFLPRLLPSAEASGQLYAVPFTTDVGLLYYRSDLTSAAQVRGLTTFQAMINLARSAMQHHGMTEGYAAQFASYEGLTVNALEAIWRHDPKAFASDGTIQDNSAVEHGLADLASAFNPGSTRQPVVPAAELHYQEEQAFQDFATGKAVFMRNWPIYYEKLAAGGPGTVPMKDVGFRLLPFPSALGGQDLAIASSSPNPQHALDVINFMTSEPAERCLYAVGGFPATIAQAYAGNSLPSGPVRGHPLCGTKTDASAQNSDFGNTILAALKTVIPRPNMPFYTEFTTLLQREVWNLLSQASQGNDGDVTQTVNDLTSDLDATATGHSP